MSSRSSVRALRIVLVLLAMLFLGAVTAQAAEPVEPTPETALQAAPDPVATKLPPSKDWLGTAMNAGAIGFCVWMVALLWRPGLGRSLLADKRSKRMKHSKRR